MREKMFVQFSARTLLLLLQITHYDTNQLPEAFPQRVFRLTPGYPGQDFSCLLLRPVLLAVTCSDKDTILVLPSLTPEKVWLPGSQLPRSRSVMTSRCKQQFSFDSTFCTLERNRNFSINGNLQLKYETKNYNLK